MTLLVAIEGADGAGKATAAENVRESLGALGHSVCVLSFPRYQQTVGGVVLGHFLSGSLPVAVTPRAAAVLYALDRMESNDLIRTARSTHEVVLFDRYVPSNMVYQASKVGEDEAAEMMEWILRLETQTFGVALPDLCIYLNTPLDHARNLMLKKQRRSYTDRQHDEHEADLVLQRKVRTNYAFLASRQAPCPWRVVDTVSQGQMRRPVDIANEITECILQELTSQSGKGNFSRIASNA